MSRIVVLGSLNIDIVQRVPRLPLPGETLEGADLQIFVGGKGANQACAAAKLGGNVRIAGKLGSDVFADRIRYELEAAGLDTSLVAKSPAASGSACILVLPTGENAIVTSPGANAGVTVDFALSVVETLTAGDLILCQLEVPLEAVAAAIIAAREKQVKTILDPAPACSLPHELLSAVGVLTPNQTETATLLGISECPGDFAAAETAARNLQSRGARTVLVKMGQSGCLIADGNFVAAIPGFRVPVTDTTAAGDAFNGALAAALARGAALAEAAVFANAAGALAVTRPGAIASIPTLAEVNEFLSSRGSKSL